MSAKDNHGITNREANFSSSLEKKVQKDIENKYIDDSPTHLHSIRLHEFDPFFPP